MTQFLQRLVTEARLKILQLLIEASPQPLNHRTLQTALASLSVRLSTDQVRVELAWLAEAGAVTLVTAGPLVVAELTERGRDIGKGHATMPGVDSPEG